MEKINLENKIFEVVRERSEVRGFWKDAEGDGGASPLLFIFCFFLAGGEFFFGRGKKGSGRKRKIKIEKKR